MVEGTAEELKGRLEGEAVSVELLDGEVDAAAEVVRSLAEVREVTADGRLLRSRVADGARAVPTILAALDSRGIQVEAVTMHRPSLDDVYLHYTGRDFRAEDEAGVGGTTSEGCRPHLVHGRAPGAEPDARADLDRRCCSSSR